MDVKVAAGIPGVTGRIPGRWQGCLGDSRDAGMPGQAAVATGQGTHQGLLLERSVTWS